MNLRSFAVVSCLFSVLAMAPARAADEPASAEAAPSDDKQASLTDINKKLSNPVSSIWSLTFQQNNFRVSPDKHDTQRWSSNLLFQPVLPVGLTPDWNLITRPVIPLFVSTARPDLNSPGLERTMAFGDISLFQLVSPSPKLAGNWLLGVGPTWILPTATSIWTGQKKWQVGPAAIVGYLSDKFILGALFQNWWSFGGSGPARTSSMILQPIASYFLEDGWSVGYSGNILANWKNSATNVYTVPIGVAVAKVQKMGPLPIRFSLGLQWMPVHPDEFGQVWNVQLIVAPVIPKLYKGNLISD